MLINRLTYVIGLSMNEEDCLHEDSENGICSDCGREIDWVSRVFKESEED